MSLHFALIVFRWLQHALTAGSRPRCTWKQLMRYVLPAMVIGKFLSSTPTKSTFAMVPKEVQTWATFQQEVRVQIDAAADGLQLDPTMTVHGANDRDVVVNEEGVREHLKTGLFNVMNIMFAHVNPCTTICRTSQPEFAFIGQPDFVAVNGTAVLFPIEVETPATLPVAANDNLVELYLFPKRGLPVKSPVQQIYAYMAGNNLTYGVLTNGRAVWFMRQRDEQLEISGAINVVSSPASQITAAEGLLHLHVLADEERLSKVPPTTPVSLSEWVRNALLGRLSWLQIMLAVVGWRTLHAVQSFMPYRIRSKEEGVYSLQDLHLGEYLGQGRNTRVCRGRVHGRSAAVKMVDLWQHPDMRQAFQHEADTYKRMMSIQGVHVPYLLAYGYIRGTGSYFIATSFEGYALSEECLDAPGPEKLQAPLSAVHACGILHNDMSPRNIAVVASGQVKILDFGNAATCRDLTVLHEETESALSILRSDRSHRTARAMVKVQSGSMSVFSKVSRLRVL